MSSPSYYQCQVLPFFADFSFGVDGLFIGLCLECFHYVQLLLPGGLLLGLYSGIFAMYLKCQSNNSSKPTILFYALCLLYVLSTFSIVSDLVFVTLQLENCIGSDTNDFSVPFWYLAVPGPQRNIMIMMFRLGVVQTVASGCCDFIAQCIMIYRCWIVWDQNIRIIIFPSFLAIAYIATWLASDYQMTNYQWAPDGVEWDNTQDKWYEGSVGFNPYFPYAVPVDPLMVTSFALSMAVNAMMTTLIVLKILQVLSEVKPTLVEQTLGTRATGGAKLRSVVFIIIESGMALFAIQLVRVVLSSLPLQLSTSLAFNLTIGINQIFNGIAPTIILVRTSMRSSVDDNESFKEAAGSLCFYNPPSDPNTLERVPVGSSSVQPQENPEENRRSEDICFNNPPGPLPVASNPITLRRTESYSNMPPQERSEITTVSR